MLIDGAYLIETWSDEAKFPYRRSYMIVSISNYPIPHLGRAIGVILLF